MAGKSSKGRGSTKDAAQLKKRITELERQESERAQEYEAMHLKRRAYHMIAESAVYAQNVTDLCSKVLEGLINYLGFDLGTIRIFDEKTGLLIPVAVIGLSDTEIREKISVQHIDDPEYLTSLVARTRQAIFAPDVEKHPVYQTHPDRFTRLNTKSMISWPVVGAQDKLLAILHLVNTTRREMPEDERSFFETAARMFSAVLQHKQLENSLRESEKKYATVFEKGNDGIVILQNEQIVLANEKIAEFTGFSIKECLGKYFLDYVAAESRDVTSENYRGRIAGQDVPGRYEISLMRKDNSRIAVEISASLIDFDGKPAVMAIVRDIAQRKVSEQLQIESAKKIENLHKVAMALAACKTPDEAYKITVKAAEVILKMHKSDLCILEGGKLVTKATSSKFPIEASRPMSIHEGIAGKTFRSHKTHFFGNIRKVPEARPVQDDLVSLISAPMGEIGVFQVFSSDENAFTKEDVRVVELLLGHTVEALKRIRLQNDLVDKTIHDPLTGVYNRYFLTQTLSQEIKRATRYRKSITFLMVDIDRFKEINDRFGHNRGDMVLQIIALILRDSVRDCDFVIRYGGDEFLVIMPETKNGVEAVKNRIFDFIGRNIQTKDLIDFPISVSVGGATWHPDDADSVEDAINRADKDMYKEKYKRLNPM